VHKSFFLRGPDGQQIILEDPSGGTFAGAGGFPSSRPETPLLAALDPYGDTILDSDDARALLAEIGWLLKHVSDTNRGQFEQARPGVARRGRLRFQRMAEYCAEHPESHILCVGGEG
jgi:hypothetical protein